MWSDGGGDLLFVVYVGVVLVDCGVIWVVVWCGVWIVGGWGCV